MTARERQQKQRKRIADELKKDPARSDREIGRLLGVDGKTVSAVRKSLQPAEIPQPNPPQAVPDPTESIVSETPHSLSDPDTRAPAPPRSTSQYVASPSSPSPGASRPVCARCGSTVWWRHAVYYWWGWRCTHCEPPRYPRRVIEVVGR